METHYSEVWKKKDSDRKDFTYTPLVKNLKDVVCFPKYDDIEMLDKILENYIEN